MGRISIKEGELTNLLMMRNEMNRLSIYLTAKHSTAAQIPCRYWFYGIDHSLSGCHFIYSTFFKFGLDQIRNIIILEFRTQETEVMSEDPNLEMVSFSSWLLLGKTRNLFLDTGVIINLNHPFPDICFSLTVDELVSYI